MRYIADHDFHIHSTISPCCHDEEQIPENILKAAKENGFKKICLTNHLWDENVKSPLEWHPKQRFSCLSSVLPLPQDDELEFLFGAEADMDYDYTVGVSPERYDVFDFIVIPTTHLHLPGYTVRERPQNPEKAAELWVKRLDELLKKDMPWHKMGIAHLTCNHIMKGRAPEVIKLLEADGWRLKNITGSHHQFVHPYKKGRVTVKSPEKDIPLKTLRMIEKQSGLLFR
jgi:predicted RNA binding protein YcfA (HicA-like mRNA interferase family)